MGTLRCAPPFVVLRGNSASGKSTVARRVQRALPRGEVAVIGQDHVRRELLWEHDSGQGDTVGLLETMVRHCLGGGRITLLEGIYADLAGHGCRWSSAARRAGHLRTEAAVAGRPAAFTSPPSAP